MKCSPDSATAAAQCVTVQGGDEPQEAALLCHLHFNEGLSVQTRISSERSQILTSTKLSLYFGDLQHLTGDCLVFSNKSSKSREHLFFPPIAIFNYSEVKLHLSE